MQRRILMGFVMAASLGMSVWSLHSGRADGAPKPGGLPGGASGGSGRRGAISTIAVIADPSRFSGREVEVMGFVSRDPAHGKYVLAPDLDSISEGLAANCVSLDLGDCDEKDQLLKVSNPCVCIVRGTVEAGAPTPGEYRMYACGFRATKCVLAASLRGRGTTDARRPEGPTK